MVDKFLMSGLSEWCPLSIRKARCTCLQRSAPLRPYPRGHGGL